MTQRDLSTWRTGTIARVLLAVTVAGCDAASACSGCGIPEITFSDSDATTQSTAATVPVATTPPAPAAPPPIPEPPPERVAAEPRVVAADAGARDPGYSVVYHQSRFDPAGGRSEGTDAAVAASTPPDAAGQATRVAAASRPAEAPPEEEPPPPEGVVLVPLLPEAPAAGFAASGVPRVNVAPIYPRSVNYPLPAVPGR